MNPWGFLILAAPALWALLAALEHIAVLAWYAPIERAQGKMNVATLVERKTRFAVLFRNNDRSTRHLMHRLMQPSSPCLSQQDDRSPSTGASSSRAGGGSSARSAPRSGSATLKRSGRRDRSRT